MAYQAPSNPSFEPLFTPFRRSNHPCEPNNPPAHALYPVSESLGWSRWVTGKPVSRSLGGSLT